jgi:hypothetical protein
MRLCFPYKPPIADPAAFLLIIPLLIADSDDGAFSIANGQS